MIKANQFRILSIISLIIPSVIFGTWNIISFIGFPVFTIMVYYLLDFKAIYGKEWVTYVASGIHGLSISLCGLTIFGVSSTIGANLISLPSPYIGIGIYIVSAFSFIHFMHKHRANRKRVYEQSFELNQSLERDKKINKLLGINA